MGKKAKKWIDARMFRSREQCEGWLSWSGERPEGPQPERLKREFKTEAGFRQWWDAQCSWGLAIIHDAEIEFGLFISLTSERDFEKQV